ncbi:hypothetical protein HID58_055697 [Brassica napus]|uniref:Pre-mRNA-splicing factor SLU7 n=1 Tax=Brassica napus TaxID=3708 RepID=A0ABQ8ALB1_BRANA|nr:hypothetical protein HID58_055697 [Brassica napus]
MATASGAFKSRANHRKQIELEEARKAGLAPAEVDEDGKEINPHIPQYMSSAPWYLNSKKPSLKHQRNWKNDLNSKSTCYDRGAKMFQAEKYRKKACQNCGAMSHDVKSCMYRPRKMDFAKVEKRVRTSGGGSTGTVRNLRIREDTAKYLLNLDVNSAHYDPKTRSMREHPLPNTDPNEKFYLGDNHYRNSGQALEFKQMNIHSWEAFDKGQDTHMLAAPSQAELLYRNFKDAKAKLISQTKDSLMEKYGNASTEDDIPMEILLGQSERQVEYDRSGRIIKGQEVILPKSRYEEDVYANNHTSVWGSWWKDQQWGYKCCKQTIRNSYCTGSAGIDAAEASLDLMKANIVRTEVRPNKVEEKRMATWGTDIPGDLELNKDVLSNALKKEDELKREEKDERKRKYNVKYNNDVTVEEMEAYRIKRAHHEDPMKEFL